MNSRAEMLNTDKKHKLICPSQMSHWKIKEYARQLESISGKSGKLGKNLQIKQIMQSLPPILSWLDRDYYETKQM